MNPAPEVPLAEEFARLLRTETGHYAEVLRLAREQNDALARGDNEKLLATLNEKQTWIAEVERLKPDAERLRARWEAERESLPAVARAEVETAWDELVKTLGAVVAAEEESRAYAHGSRDEAGQRVARLQQGKAMHRAYGKPPPTPPASRFSDRDA